jgi:DNA-binding transcriptional ArsR family regulator
MTMAWKSGLSSGQKMVLLALCDNANDQGECYPSVPMLAEKCSMGERTVQQHISDLEAAGIVKREMRTGRSTLYRIDPRKICTPAESAPPQNLHPTPADFAPPPPQNLHPTPADFAPITINEPSIEPSRKRQRRVKPAPVAAVKPTLPDWLPLDAWDGYLQMRREKKKPPTEHAVKLLLSDLAKWHAAGHDVAIILNTSTKNGWTDVYEPKVPARRSTDLPAVATSTLTKAGQATARNMEAWLERKRQEQGNA